MKKSVLLSVIILSLTSNSVLALDTATHEYLNNNIATMTLNGFSFDTYLKTTLGMPDGVSNVLSSSISGKSFAIFDWLRKGGLYEDKPPWVVPYIRSANHFHDPITDKGFTGLPPGDSAIVWSQKPIGQQWIGCHYSWLDSRDNFYKALTESDQTKRDEKFAETFRGIGQLMHLIQDMSVPEHSRNDSHALPAYEEWLADKSNSIASDILSNSSINPTYPDSTLLLKVSPFSNATVPIANLFDTNQYPASGTVATPGTTFGLSEYTNANFFSPDTILASSYPYPGLSSMQAYDETLDPVTLKKRRYFRKTADGEQVEHLATSRWFYSYLPTSLKELGLKLDEKVYADYAAKLLPRAVGYSSALLDYFFRGTIELSLPGQGVYAIAAPDGTFNEIHVNAKNSTTTGEEMSNGEIQLVVKYDLALSDPFKSVPVDVAPTTCIVVPEKNGVTTISKTTPIELIFDLSTNPIPLWATDVYIQVIYKGRLGNEIDSVAVGFKDISEPTPIDIANNMDLSCINGNYMIAGSDEAISASDTNNDGTADWDVFPHGLTNVYLAFNGDAASPTNYIAKFASIPPGNYGRVFVLADYTVTSPALYVSSKVTVEKLDLIRDSWSMESFTVPVYARDAINNQDYYPILDTERGLENWFFIHYENTNGFACDSKNASPLTTAPVAVTL